MFKGYILSLMSLVTLVSGFAQNKCSKYYPIKKGAQFTHTIFSDEPSNGGVEQGKVIYKVNEVGANWAFYTVKIEAMGFSRPEIKQKIVCTDQGVSITNQHSSAEKSDISGDSNFYLPNDLSATAVLDDVEMKLTHQGMASITRRITNRKVLGVNEAVTTPAGKFSCYKLTQTTKMGTFTTFDTQWMGEDVGIVKTVERDSGGNILSVTVLSSYYLPNNEQPAAKF